MPRNKVRIELRPPCQVDGRPARYQSLWLLLRLYYADRQRAGPVPVSALLARFPGAAKLRMMVSRAYADYRAWDVSVGWGRHADRDPALLELAGRSRGPFWLAPGEAQRLDIRLDGKPVDLARVSTFLGAESLQDGAGDPVAYVMQDVTYWNELTHALRMAKDGMGASSERGVAQRFRVAHRAAKDDFQAALSVLKESLAWRRHGQVERSEDALLRLQPYLHAKDDRPALPSFAAMAAIAHGWNLYAQGGVPAAQAELARIGGDLELQPVIRYNPRVRFEFLNLRALLSKSVAMALQTVPLAERAEAATRAIQDLSGALQAAYEADSIESAQDVAANIGWSLWLFWINGLLDPTRRDAGGAVQLQAIRWIGLSEWICDRFGVGGGSAWNTVFLLRIARGGCAAKRQPDLRSFQAEAPLSIGQVVQATQPYHAPFSPAKGYTSWSNVARFTLEEHDAGHAQYGPLQMANLLLETAWFSAYESGLCAQAYEAVARLRKLMRSLRPDERRFFGENLKYLPVELAAA